MERPADAEAEFVDYNGQRTWVRDLTGLNSTYPMGRVWSHPKKRWRVKRELIAPERFTWRRDT